jgi:hypothetical protein
MIIACLALVWRNQTIDTRGRLKGSFGCARLCDAGHSRDSSVGEHGAEEQEGEQVHAHGE